MVGVKVLLLLLLLLYGCSGGPTIPESDSPEGRIYMRRCGTCHSPPEPQKYPFERWKDFLGLMEMEMARKGLPPLEGKEKAVILEYLERYSGRGEGG